MKKLFSIFIALVTVFSLISTCYAQGSANSNNVSGLDLRVAEQKEIDEMIDQLIFTRMEMERDLRNRETNTIGNTHNKEIEANLLAKLQTKGVRKLTHIESQKLQKASQQNNQFGVSPLAATPPSFTSTNTVDVLTGGERTVSVNGSTVKLWIIYMIPKATGNGGPLYRSYRCPDLYDYTTPFQTFKNKLFKIYADKGIAGLAGLYPFLSWTPYELLSGVPSYTNNTKYEVNVDISSKMKYVYKYHPTSDVWTLMASTNNVAVSELHIFHGLDSYSNPVIVPQKARNYAVYAYNYSNIDDIAASLIGGVYADSVGNWSIKNDKDQTKLTVKPPFYTYPIDPLLLS